MHLHKAHAAACLLVTEQARQSRVQLLQSRQADRLQSAAGCSLLNLQRTTRRVCAELKPAPEKQPKAPAASKRRRGRRRAEPSASEDEDALSESVLLERLVQTQVMPGV